LYFTKIQEGVDTLFKGSYLQLKPDIIILMNWLQNSSILLTIPIMLKVGKRKSQIDKDIIPSTDYTTYKTESKTTMDSTPAKHTQIIAEKNS